MVRGGPAEPEPVELRRDREGPAGIALANGVDNGSDIADVDIIIAGGKIGAGVKS